MHDTMEFLKNSIISAKVKPNPGPRWVRIMPTNGGQQSCGTLPLKLYQSAKGVFACVVAFFQRYSKLGLKFWLSDYSLIISCSNISVKTCRHLQNCKRLLIRSTSKQIFKKSCDTASIQSNLFIDQFTFKNWVKKS